MKGTEMSSLLNEPDGLQATSEVLPEAKSSIKAKSKIGGLTQKQQFKLDTLDLAELIYDIFKEGMSSASIGAVTRKDGNNA